MNKVFILLFLSTLWGANAQAEAPYIYVLGVAQDAGYPQAGCYKPHCMPAWREPALRRGATSLGLIDPLTNRKYLFEATPDLPSQLFALEQQAPSERYSLGGVFVTHAHIGHYAGLMFFGHEAMGTDKVAVYSMPRMQSFLSNNGPWNQLLRYQNIVLKHLQNQTVVELGALHVTPFVVPHRDEFSETVGYRIDGPNKSAIFIPDIDKWSKWSVDLSELLKSVDYALIDATFFGDDELPGRDMSKVPHPLVTESMNLLDKLLPKQKNKVWFIHMNHTNPLLQIDSKESQQVRAKGYNIAVEGLRLSL